MKYTFNATSLTKPTQETLEEISKKRFKKIDRLLNRHEEYILRISATKERNDFNVTVELHPNKIVINESNKDLRLAVTAASEQLKGKLSKEKDKRTDKSRIRAKLDEYLGKVTEIFE